MLGSIFRVVTIILSTASFIPHYRKIIFGDASGISLYYVLFNLIVTTHQFFLGVLFYVLHFESNSSLVHGEQATILEWLNFGQFITSQLCFLGLFILCLIYPSNKPPHNTNRHVIISVYVIVLLLYISPYVITIGSPESPKWFLILTWYYYIVFYGNYIITGLGIASLFFQWPYAASLSRLGLFLQAAVFLLVAISWVLLISYEDLKHGMWYTGCRDWYPLIGFAVVDNAVFAVVQAVLYFKVWRGVTRAIVPGTENEPLLGSVGGSGT